MSNRHLVIQGREQCICPSHPHMLHPQARDDVSIERKTRRKRLWKKVIAIILMATNKVHIGELDRVVKQTRVKLLAVLDMLLTKDKSRTKERADSKSCEVYVPSGKNECAKVNVGDKGASKMTKATKDVPIFMV